MKKVLRDPIAPRERTNGDYPFEFKAPAYDNRSSCAMKAGNYYGVGFRTPEGKERASPLASGPIPMESYAFSPDVVMYGEDVKG